MPRLFLAVPVPNRIKTQLAAEIGKLQKSLPDWTINWVAPENLHVTLVFFGWVKEGGVEPLKTEISTAPSGFAPFKITTGELSLEGRPLWLEIEAGREEMEKLAQALAEKLTLKGSLAEERGFHAHLTLGRVKNRSKSKLPEVKERFSWKADRVALYESRFEGGRRIYTETASFPICPI